MAPTKVKRKTPEKKVEPQGFTSSKMEKDHPQAMFLFGDRF